MTLSLLEEVILRTPDLAAQLRQDNLGVGGVPSGTVANVTGATGIAPSEAGPPKVVSPGRSKRRLRKRI